jgi:RecA/RadA recombinase
MASKSEMLKKLGKLNTDIAGKLKTGKEGYDVFRKFAGITEYIDMGNYILNAQMSGSLFGGIPNTRSVEIAGEPSSGKSFVCMNVTRELTKAGYYVYYIDTEGALEEGDFIKFGAVAELVNYIRTIKTYSQLKFFMNQLLAQKDTEGYKDLKIACIVDSYGMLNTEKELADSQKGKTAADMGLRAKEGRQLFRNITLDLSNMAIPFIFTNHTGASLDMFAPNPKTGGGDGPTYSASSILILAKRVLAEENKDGSKTRTGIIVKSKTDKNRLARPIEVHFHISFEKGMNRYVGLEDYFSWENCGVAKGTIFSEADFLKKWKKGVATNSTGKELVTHTWEVKAGDNKGKWYCVESDRAKTFAVQDTCSNVDPKYFFTGRLFTPGTLLMLDERVIKPLFKYKDISDLIDEELDDLKAFVAPPSTDEATDEITGEAKNDFNLIISENE